MASQRRSIIRAAQEIPKVQVRFLMESLCVDCKRFMVEQLFPTYGLLGDTVMDLKVFPFGNAELSASAKTVTCQHGLAECDANSFEQCAIHIYPYAPRYLPFLFCLDTSLPMGYSDDIFPRSVFADCARRSALDFDSIAACHDNPEQSWRLQKQAAKATPKEHSYVPWVMINGVHTFDEEKDSLLHVVCKIYHENGGQHAACPGYGIRGVNITVDMQ